MSHTGYCFVFPFFILLTYWLSDRFKTTFYTITKEHHLHVSKASTHAPIKFRITAHTRYSCLNSKSSSYNLYLTVCKSSSLIINIPRKTWSCYQYPQYHLLYNIPRKTGSCYRWSTWECLCLMGLLELLPQGTLQRHSRNVSKVRSWEFHKF